MAQIKGDMVYAVVSTAVSAGDGVPYDVTLQQPSPLTVANGGLAATAAVSNPQIDMLEVLRRCFTNITTPSTTIVSGGSAGSIALAFGTASPSGIGGMFQGVPFVLSAAGTASGAPTSLISTASNEIRKVLVCIGMSALPVTSSLALGGGTIQFTYGPAYYTSAGACTSGGQGVSFFDRVPLPRASANEIPVGWLNVVNSFSTSAGIINSCMMTDFRVTQGMNFNAMIS